jgi:hypothetical protein
MDFANRIAPAPGFSPPHHRLAENVCQVASLRALRA